MKVARASAMNALMCAWQYLVASYSSVRTRVLSSMHALSLACIVNFTQDPSLAAALHADPALEEEMDEQQDEEMPQNGATLKTGFPKLEDDMQPSSLLLPASKCMSRHAKKLDQLLLRFKPNPESEGQGKELTDLQASLLG